MKTAAGGVEALGLGLARTRRARCPAKDVLRRAHERSIVYSGGSEVSLEVVVLTPKGGLAEVERVNEREKRGRGPSVGWHDRERQPAL